jgi:protein SCO1
VEVTRTGSKTDARPPLRGLVLAMLMCLVLGGVGGLLVAGITAPDAPATRFYPPREAARDFRLRDQDGRWTTIHQGQGKAIVLTFLYSTCRDLCPAQAADIVQALGRLGRRASEVLVYGVGVDPVGDTSARARAFLKKYGVYGGPVHFLVGDRADLAPVWRAYGIAPINATRQEAAGAAAGYDRLQRRPPAKSAPYEPPSRLAPPAARQDYPDTEDLQYRGHARHHAGLDFEHSAYVMLIDKHGTQRVGIPFEQLTLTSLAAGLRRLLSGP